MIIGSINTPLEQNLPVVTFMKKGLLQNCWINFRLLCLINSKWPRGNNNSHNCWRSAAGTRSIWFHELFTVKRLTKLLPQIPASQEQNTQDLNVSAHWLQITSQRNLIPSSLDRLPSFSLVISCDLLCENRLKVTENSVACCCLSPGSKLPETFICCLLTDQSFSLLFFLIFISLFLFCCSKQWCSTSWVMICRQLLPSVSSQPSSETPEEGQSPVHHG